MHKSGPPEKRLKQLSIKNMFDQHRLSKKFSEPVTPKPCLNPSKDELTRTSENKVHQPFAQKYEMEDQSQSFATAEISKKDMHNSKLICALEECERRDILCAEANVELLSTESANDRGITGKSISDDFDVSLHKSESCNLHQSAVEDNLLKNKRSSCPMEDDSADLFATNSQSSSDCSLVQHAAEQEVLSSMGTPFDQLKTLFNCSSHIAEQSASHTILFEGAYDGINPPARITQDYTDRWDSHHVRLPCSSKSLYPVQTPAGKKLSARWDMIQSALLMGVSSSLDLEEAILTYNSRFSEQWSFQALHRFFTEVADGWFTQNVFENTLPKMVELALSLPQLFPEPIPLLCQHRCQKVTMSQQQIACLLCNAFFCTFPRRNSRRPDSEYANYPDINFNRMFQAKTGKRDKSTSEKIRTFFHYFQRVTDKMPLGAVTFERRSLHDFPVWSQSSCTLGKLHISSKGKIEDAAGLLQVDFANSYIGGGVLRTGLVQEEIRFCICPELVAAMLFMERMDDNECIIVTGVERYSEYTGYAETYKWAGDYVDETPRDDLGRRKCQIVAIDATSFTRPTKQYALTNVQRELNKAYCGFYCENNPHNAPAIATGNWGCGAFNGDPLFKGLLQLMAAAAAGRALCYFTFDDTKLMEELYEMHRFITEKEMRICDLWRTIDLYGKETVAMHDPTVPGKMESIAQFIVRTHTYSESTDEDL